MTTRYLFPAPTGEREPQAQGLSVVQVVSIDFRCQSGVCASGAGETWDPLMAWSQSRVEGAARPWSVIPKKVSAC